MEKVGNYLIDSDILIDYLRGIQESQGFLSELRVQNNLWISAINIMEIYSGKDIKNKIRNPKHLSARIGRRNPRRKEKDKRSKI